AAINNVDTLSGAKADTVLFDRVCAARNDGRAQLAARQAGGGLKPRCRGLQCQRPDASVGVAAAYVVGIGLQIFDAAARENARKRFRTRGLPRLETLGPRYRGIRS